MGQSAAETVREIEETRDKLEEDLRELEERMPASARFGKKVVGIAVGGGIAGTVLMFGLKRWRKGHSAKKSVAQPAAAVIQVLPDTVAKKVGEAFEDGRWRGYAAGAAGLWALLKVAELRQQRKLTAALMAR